MEWQRLDLPMCIFCSTFEGEKMHRSAPVSSTVLKRPIEVGNTLRDMGTKRVVDRNSPDHGRLSGRVH